jgi:hypothetical protein
MRSPKWRRICLSLLIPLFASLVLPSIALAAPSFVNNNFKAKWERADKPVDEGSAVRSWLWGPEGFNPSTGVTETYAESPGGVRQVQYFDKARMELNNPANGYVSNGLLVRELISGKLATGDAAFTQRRLATDIAIAGDSGNNQGPVYSSFAKVASLNNDNEVPSRVGSPVAETIQQNGTIGTSPDLGNLTKYAYYEPNLKHNIPEVFWNFMNQRGTVFENGLLAQNQPVLGDNPLVPWLDATGYALTEAYWAKVTVAGQVKDVLIQVFERRVLTFTPSNPPAFQVEMGNVGRHYYEWRYNSKYDVPTTPPPPTPPPVPAVKNCEELPPSNVGLLLKCGPAGIQIFVGGKMQPDETINIVGIDPTGQSQASYRTKTNRQNGEFNIVFDTLPDYKTGMWTYKLRGETSSQELTAYIWLDPPVTAPVIIYEPKVAKMNETIAFNYVGFKPNEELVLTLTNPERRPLIALNNLKAGAGGGYFDTILIDRDLPEQARKTGDYILVVRAKNDSNRYANITFTILPK